MKQSRWRRYAPVDPLRTCVGWLILLLIVAAAIALGGCGTKFDRDPLKVYQADPIDFNIPVMAVVPF